MPESYAARGFHVNITLRGASDAHSEALIQEIFRRNYVIPAAKLR